MTDESSLPFPQSLKQMFPEKYNRGITLPFKIFVYKLSTINLRCRIVLVFRVWVVFSPMAKLSRFHSVSGGKVPRTLLQGIKH
jgi:hypothetical protein